MVVGCGINKEMIKVFVGDESSQWSSQGRGRRNMNIEPHLEWYLVVYLWLGEFN